MYKALAAAAFAGCVLFGGAALAQTAPPPVEAYGRLPAIGDAAISPDGHRLALSVGYEYSTAQPDRDLTAFSILNIDAGQMEHTLAPPPHNTFRGVGWGDDNHPFYLISSTQRPGEMQQGGSLIRGGQVEYWRIGVYNLDDNDSHILMERDSSAWANTSLATLLAPVRGDPGYGRIIAWSGITDMNATPRLAVFRVNLSNGRSGPVAQGVANTRDFLLDDAGNVVAREDIDEDHDHWALYVYDQAQPRVLKEGALVHGVPGRLYGRLADGRLAGTIPSADDMETVLAIDPHTGASAPLYGDGDVDIIEDPWTHAIIGAGGVGDLPQQHFFDTRMQGVYTALQSLFSDGYASIHSWSQDHSRYLVFGEHATDAGAYYVYEPAARHLRRVANLYPALNNEAALGDRQAITFHARDHTPVPAYLTLPAGVDPHHLPLVLLVHGGPHVRDTMRFDWWASFLASRGYAVLQVNYRGSTGYGTEWFNAGLGQWGDGVMQTDLEDGVDALIRNGTVDAHRVCIVGGSYGGYAALAGATLTPDRYACAASIAGVADPVRFLNDAESGDYGSKGMSAQWWLSSMGSDMTHLHKVSPIDHVDVVRIPILMMHGQEDSVVPFLQSQTMVDRLQNAHKNVRFVVLHGDDHWLSAAPTRTQMLAELETFLNANIGSGYHPAH
ncbi:MAG: S9 family peptidase [Alphaproteobacteria bacterium]